MSLRYRRILTISQVPLPPLLLDTYPNAEVAFSFRKLTNAYSGSCVRIRRSSDDTELDIGFDINGVVDTAAITSFVSGDSAYITIWYDQSGNARDAGQVIPGLQPRVVNAGVLETQNSLLSARFDGSNDFLEINPGSTVNIEGVDFSTFITQKRRTGGVIGGIIGGGGSGGILAAQFSDNNIYFQHVLSTGTNGAFYRFAADATSTFCLIESHYGSSTLTGYKNGTAYTLSAPATFTTTDNSIILIGQYGSLIGNNTDGHISEIIHWNQDQTSVRTNIHSDITTYYTIP